MKKIFFILSLILIGIMVIVGPDESHIYETSQIIAEIPSYHTCIDPNHYYCDGGETTEIIADSLNIPIINENMMCECDGLGCSK